MYYRIEVEPTLNCGNIELDKKFKLFKLFLLRGSRVDEKTIPQPWLFTIEPNPRHELVMNDYYPEFHLMHKRMVEVLQARGVANLQVFPATVRNTSTNEINEEFVVVNIVGLVACADSALSDSSDLADKKFFHRLVIDPSRAGGLLLFRLEESRLDVIVHEQVAVALRDGNLRNVALEAVEVA